MVATRLEGTNENNGRVGMEVCGTLSRKTFPMRPVDCTERAELRVSTLTPRLHPGDALEVLSRFPTDFYESRLSLQSHCRPDGRVTGAKRSFEPRALQTPTVASVGEELHVLIQQEYINLPSPTHYADDLPAFVKKHHQLQPLHHLIQRPT